MFSTVGKSDLYQANITRYFQDQETEKAVFSESNQIEDRISKLFCLSLRNPNTMKSCCQDENDVKPNFGVDQLPHPESPRGQRWGGATGMCEMQVLTQPQTSKIQECLRMQTPQVHLSSLPKERQKQKYEKNEKLTRIERDYDEYLKKVWCKYVEKNCCSGGQTKKADEVWPPALPPPPSLPAMATSLSPGGQPCAMAGSPTGNLPHNADTSTNSAIACSLPGPQLDADQSPVAGRGRGIPRTPPVRLPGLARGNNMGGGGPSDPGGGRGGGGGGAPDGQAGQDQQQQPQQQDLVIRTSPTIWGVVGPPSAEKCLQAWYSRFNELYDEIETKFSSIPPKQRFEWIGANVEGGQWNQAAINQQFLAMMVVHICTRDLPGSHPYHGYVDFFEFDNNYKLIDASIDYSIKFCLSGVNFNNPLERFSSLDQLDPGTIPPEVNLRSGLIILMKMIEDIVNQPLKVSVEFTFDNGNATPATTIFRSDYITDTLHKALAKVSFVFHNIFSAQHAAYVLADKLEGINDDSIGDLEELHCDMVTDASLAGANADVVDRARSMAKRMMKTTNEARRAYRTYEAAVSKVSDEGAITATAAQRVFADMDMLIKFFRNESSSELAWIKAPNKFSTVKCQVTVGGATMKTTENPSRLWVPYAWTPVDASILKAKETVEKVLDVLKMRDTAPSVPVPLSFPESSRVFQSSVDPPKPVYPMKLLKDALYFRQSYSSSDVDEETPVYILEDFLIKTKEYVTQIQDSQWKYGVVLSSDHCVLLEDLTKMKTSLTGMIKLRDEEKRRLENEQRELAKTLQVSKPVHLLPSGVNVGQYLFYHEQFKCSNKMSRVLKLRETLPRELLPRVENEVCPDAILKLISDLFLNQDYLIPVARREVEKQRNCPRPHSDEERSSYNAIFGLIQRLKQAGLESKLDFTMMGLSLQKLSRVRQDSFEEKWLMKSIELEGQPMEVIEEEKRKLFVAFITLNENLLVRRQLQNSIMKADEEKGKGKLPRGEKAFTVRVTKHEKRVAKGGVGSGQGVAQDKDDLQCPVCGDKGGHPRTRGARIGKSAKSVARCQQFRDMPQDQKLGLIDRIGCSRCLTYGSHNNKTCQLPAETHWLQHDSCSEKAGSHHPSVCPSRPQASTTSFGSQ